MSVTVRNALAFNTSSGTNLGHALPTTGTGTTSTALVVGDPLLVQVTTNANNHTFSGLATGWVQVYAQAVGTCTVALFKRTGGYQTGDTFTLTSSTAAACSINMVALNGSVHSDFNGTPTLTTRGAAATTTTAPAAGSTGNDVLVLFHEKTTSQTSCVVTPTETDILNTFPITGQAGSAYIGGYSATSGTHSVTATYGLTANANGAGSQWPLVAAAGAPVNAAGMFALNVTASGASDPTAGAAGTFGVNLTAAGAGPPQAATAGGFGLNVTAAGAGSTPSVSGTFALNVTSLGAAAAAPSVAGSSSLNVTAAGTPSSGSAAGTFALNVTARLSAKSQVTDLLAYSPFYAYHRGGSADWVQDTAYAYAHSTAWNGDTSRIALEVSVVPTSDGYWMLSDQLTTGAVFNSNLTISSSTKAQLDVLRTTTGSFPPMYLEDGILQVYPGWVLLLDNKAQTSNSTLLALLATYGRGPQNVIGKAFAGQGSWLAACKAAGYQTWGYFYDASVGNGDLATYQGNCTILGMNHDATSASWTTVLSYGKPVIAHVVDTAAHAATALSQGASGLMVSGVMEVVPPGVSGGFALNVTAAGAVSSASAAASFGLNVTSGATVSSGSAAGSFGLNVTSTGAPSASPTGTVAVNVTGSSAAQGRAAGGSQINVTMTGTTGSAPTVSGSFALNVTSAGSTSAQAAGTANVTVTASGGGSGSTAGAYQLTVTASSSAAASPAGTVQVTVNGAGTANTVTNAAGTYGLTVSATGAASGSGPTIRDIIITVTATSGPVVTTTGSVQQLVTVSR